MKDSDKERDQQIIKWNCYLLASIKSPKENIQSKELKKGLEGEIEGFFREKTGRHHKENKAGGRRFHKNKQN